MGVSAGLKRGEIRELSIEGMATGGLGVGRYEGLVVFVKGAIPGERVRAVVTQRKKGHAEARVLDILSTSSCRVAPPCPHAGSCGGCQWQHIDYEAQLHFKKEIITQCVEKIGGIKDVTVKAVKPSPNFWGYRNKMEFSFTDRRWLPCASEEEKDLGVFLGLHVPGTFSKVVDIEKCLLLPEAGNLLLKAVKEMAQSSGALVYGLKSHRGFWRFLTIRHSTDSDKWMLNIVTSDEKGVPLEDKADKLLADFSYLSTIVHTINSRRAAIAVGEKERILRGDGFLTERLGRWIFRVSASSFFQTNTKAAEVLYDTVAAFTSPRKDDEVLDLYSGTGTIPIYLSRDAGTITGMELNEAAVLDARINCETNGVDNCRFLCGDIKELLKRYTLRPRVVIVDPPRSGMHKDVADGLLTLAASEMVYVSCNPATMARDLSILSSGYHIVEIQPVDMFPQTYHVECVVRLERKTWR